MSRKWFIGISFFLMVGTVFFMSLIPRQWTQYEALVLTMICCLYAFPALWQAWPYLKMLKNKKRFKYHKTDQHNTHERIFEKNEEQRHKKAS